MTVAIADMISGVYSIKNLVNNKIYIGSSTNIKHRFANHKAQLRNNRHYNIHLQRAFNKYKEENFEFKIEKEVSPDLIRKEEGSFIQKYNSYNYKNGYNKADISEEGIWLFNKNEKIKRSKLYLKRYNNYSNFKCINIKTKEEKQFNNLTEAAEYVMKNNFSKAKKIEAVKQNISKCLREVKTSLGSWENTIKIAFKHNWIIIN